MRRRSHAEMALRSYTNSGISAKSLVVISFLGEKMTFLSLVIREYIASGPHSNEAASPSKDVSRLFIVTCLFADKAFIFPKRRSSFSAASII